MTESACRAYSMTGTPEAVLALKIRAPSMWTLSPWRSATARMALRFSSGQDRAAPVVMGVLDADEGGLAAYGRSAS